MRRRDFITLIGGAATGWPLVARAQQGSVPIIGFLSSLSAAALSGPVTAFRQGLGSVGYEDGKNVAIAFEWAEGHYDLLPALAAELVKQRPAVIVTVGGDPSAFAAKAASSKIPLVFMVGQDPVKLGLVTSLSRPGGNATGVNLLVTETESKRVEILKQLAPGASNLAALINPKNADADLQSSAVKAAAQAIGQQIEVIGASTDIDLENAFARFTLSNINGLLLLADPFFVYRRKRIIKEAAQRHIPAVYFLREFAESGGLARVAMKRLVSNQTPNSQTGGVGQACTEFDVCERSPKGIVPEAGPPSRSARALNRANISCQTGAVYELESRHPVAVQRIY